MLKAAYTKQFEKDLKLAQKRGKNLDKIKSIIEILLANKPLAINHRDHWLTGNYANRCECHVESDYLLVYKPIKNENMIIFERLGTHSDLFK